MCLQRFYPEVPHLGRPCWWQLLWWWSLLGGTSVFSTTRWCTCPLSGKEIVWRHVSLSGSWGWGGHPSCLGVQQPHDPQTPGHVSSPTLHHFLIFYSFSFVLIQFLLFFQQIWVKLLRGAELDPHSGRSCFDITLNLIQLWNNINLWRSNHCLGVFCLVHAWYIFLAPVSMIGRLRW